MVAPAKPETIPDWRQEFPPEGPPTDAPAAVIEKYLCLRFYELVRRCDRMVDYALRGIRDTDAAGTKIRRDPTAEDIARLKPHIRGFERQFRALQHWKEVSGYSAAEASIEDVDLDALASEICRRMSAEWTGAEAKTALGRKRRDVPPEGPSSDFTLAQKRTWFQRLHGQTAAQSEALSQRSGEIEAALSAMRSGSKGMDAIKARAALVRLQRQLIALADQALKHKEAIVSAWAKLVGAVFDSKDKMKAARQGDYFSYRDINGFTESAKGSRWSPLFLGDAHREIIATLMADLCCKKCGCFHLGDQTPTYEVASGMEIPQPVTCPYCGQEDCAGQRKHRLAACRGLGKSTESRLSFAFRIGLALRRDYVPEAMILSGTIVESIKRKKLIIAIMRRPAHRLIFPQAVAKRKPAAQVLEIIGQDRPVANCYGIKSVPPGAHVDIIHADDVVNTDNVFRVPADQITVQRKVTEVLRFSDKPWTIFDWLTTVWKIDDPDHHLEKVAEARPDEWVNTVIAAGGPEPVHDEMGRVVKKAWWSPWPQRWDEDELHSLWDEDEFAYQRAMQMIRVSERDCIFHEFTFYLSDADSLLKNAPEDFLKECVVAKRSEMMNWPHVAGFDLAFTPAEKATSKHSQTVGTVIAIDPWSKRQFVRTSDGQYLEPSEHEGYIVQTCKPYPTPDVIIETTQTVSELVRRLQDQGLAVSTYTPNKFGPKEYRKYPLSMNVNSGRILFPGRLAQRLPRQP